MCTAQRSSAQTKIFAVFVSWPPGREQEVCSWKEDSECPGGEKDCSRMSGYTVTKICEKIGTECENVSSETEKNEITNMNIYRKSKKKM